MLFRACGPLFWPHIPLKKTHDFLAGDEIYFLIWGRLGGLVGLSGQGLLIFWLKRNYLKKGFYCGDEQTGGDRGNPGIYLQKISPSFFGFFGRIFGGGFFIFRFRGGGNPKHLAYSISKGMGGKGLLF